MLRKRVKLNQSNRKTATQTYIIILSMFGLMICIAVLFPQVRQMLVDLAEQILHKKIYQGRFVEFLFYAMGGICFILFFDYCTLTASGRLLIQQVKREIQDGLSEIDFRSLLKPVLIMSGVYLLGILTIIRANYLYVDDLGRSIYGYREWSNWSRYVSSISSIFIHGDTNLTDISPLPQLLAILILSISSVLLVYVICNGKITTVRLLASLPLGLSPYFLECLSYKFDAPYMAISVFASIIPFLFFTRKKAFLFCSVMSLLIMCMTYQAASGIYLLIVVMLCFQDWNSRKRPNKEILSFLGVAAFAFCLAMILFKVFFMKPNLAVDIDNPYYATTEMYPLSDMVSGILTNIKTYAMIIYHDFGIIWKIGIVCVCILFIAKSIYVSATKKTLAFFVSFLIIGLSFLLSYGVYSMLMLSKWYPRFLFGFGIFLSILCIYVVSDYKKIATVTVLALNWCLLVFAFSYGNALADQARYEEFRIGILLHDLNSLYPNSGEEGVLIRLENTIDYAPSVKNISKHYPVIENLVPKRLGGNAFWEYQYYLKHFNNDQYISVNGTSMDFHSLNLPVVLDSYYHTIKSDGPHCLILLKH